MEAVVQVLFEPSHNVVACELGDGLAILDLEKNVYFSLNDVGGAVWSLLRERPHSAQSVADTIVADFAVETAECQRDIALLFDELSQAGLIRPLHGQA